MAPIVYVFILSAFAPHLLLAALKSDGKTHLHLDMANSHAALTVDDGFHFNIEAPTHLSTGKKKLPAQFLSEKRLEFKWTGPLGEKAKIQYYVCDDAKTVCEPHSDSLTAPLQPQDLSPKQAKQYSKVSTKSVYQQGIFVLNDQNSALKFAKKENRPILIDFTASWCPACLRLEHESFSSETFKIAAKPFVLSKIDVDLENNHDLIEQYSIHAYPTLIITDSNGNELDRILDYIPAEALANHLKKFSIKGSISIEQLQKKALQGDETAILEVGTNAFRSQNMPACIHWLGKLRSKPIEYFMCLISLHENDSSESRIDSLKLALLSYPQSFYSIEWRLELAKLMREKGINKDANSVLNDAALLVISWQKQPTSLLPAHANHDLLEITDLVLPELYNYLGDIYLALDKKTLAHEQFERAVRETLKLKPTTKNPTIILYLVHYLKKAGQSAEALGWLTKLAEKYPNEFTYAHRQASLLMDEKNFLKAHPFAEKAYSLSYGTNKLKTGLLLARVLVTMKQNQKAKALLNELLTSKVAQYESNKKLVGQLSKTLHEIN